MKNMKIVNSDCLDWCLEQPNDCVDLVFGSPPYESQRTYGIGFDLRGEGWVAWMVERMAEFVIRSFCPPGGTVLDPFSGSGTTAAASIATDRRLLV